MFFTIYLLSLVCSVLSLLFIITYAFFTYRYSYWKRLGVKGPKPSFPEGNFNGFWTRKTHISKPLDAFYKEFSHEKYFGIYNLFKPILVVTDLDMIKNILVKDYEHFNSHGLSENFDLEPLSNHLFNQSGTLWKNMRVKLSPIFTSGKLKMMSQIMIAIQNSLDTYIKSELKSTNILGIKHILGNFTMEVICNCAFGLESNSFVSDSEFVRYAKEALIPQKLKEQIAVAFSFISPETAEKLGISSQHADMVRFFKEIINTTIDRRKTAGIRRNDFLQFMMDIADNSLTDDDGKPIKHDGNSFTRNDVICQSFLLLLAGYETSSSAGTFALLEMSMNMEIQEKARAEILQVLKKYDGKCTYDAVQEMKYLNMVVEETLRLHPALNMLLRKCTKDYKLDEKLTVRKGESVFIPVSGIHRDSKYYADPERFDPERFGTEEKNRRHKLAYLSFGEGPRVCIGKRFGILQVKLALITILSQYKVLLSNKTVLPVEEDPVPLVVLPKGEVFLELKPLHLVN